MSRYKTGHKQPRFVIQFWPAAWRGQISLFRFFSTRCHLYPSNGGTRAACGSARLSMENTTVAADNNVEKNVRRLPQMPGHF